MRNLRLLYAVIALAMVLSPSFAADKKIIESQWSATPVQIDGSKADWAQTPFEARKDFDLNFAFKNDAEFLYLLFAFNSNKYMSSIDFSGLTVWINTEGKEKKNYGLHFARKQVTGDQLIQSLEKQGQTLSDDQKKEIKTRPQYILFICDPVDKKGNPLVVAGSTKGTFRTAKFEKSILFEYQLPIALLQDPSLEAKWDPSQPLKIGFEWGGMTEEMRKNQGSMLGDQSARAGASEGSLEGQIKGETSVVGGGMSGDMDAAARRRNAPKKYDFWIDLKLAAKQ